MSVMDEYLRIKAKLQADVETVLLTHVAPAVKEEMQAQVYDKVYAVYTPKVYERRYQDGGLGDIRNYEASVDSGTMTLTVQNLTRDDWYWRPYQKGSRERGKPEVRKSTGQLPDRYIAPVVEGSGDPDSDYDYGYPGPHPRKFHEPAEKEVVRNGTVERELRIGLSALGHEIKEG